jgi:hypothetical protein
MRRFSVVAILLGAQVALANPTKHAAMSFAPPVVTGTLDSKVVAPIVKRAKTQLLACYKKGLAKAVDDFQGEVKISFTIAADGKVTSSAATGFNTDLETCVAQVVAKLRFAKKGGDASTEVTYPINFSDGNIYGGLIGNEAGEMSGGFGFGRSGFGPGGGGTGWGTIGTGSGTGSGYGGGGGRGGMRGRASAVPNLSIGQPSTAGTGELDKAIIRRYIKRNAAKLLYCYEKELLANTKLAEGTVTTEFQIMKTGLVASGVKASGVDANVSTCVADVIQAIEFPKPKNDGEVNMTYPFTFRKPTPQPADDQRSSTPSPRK